MVLVLTKQLIVLIWYGDKIMSKNKQLRKRVEKVLDYAKEELGCPSEPGDSRFDEGFDNALEDIIFKLERALKGSNDG